MSFKLFIYYSALCGAWAAFLGWGLGRALAPNDDFWKYLVRGLSLGVLVALAVGLVDAMWNRSALTDFCAQGLVAALVGGCGGLAGSLIGVALIGHLEQTGSMGQELLRILFTLLGWTITGSGVGASVGLYDMATRLRRGEHVGGALRKVRHGLLGGAMGGLVGGWLYVLVPKVFGNNLRSPSAVGFVALGLFIGLMIGLAQIMLKEAWLKIESGSWAGREWMLSKAETTIGRAESCDVGLFRDSGVERLHARILRDHDRYLLADAGTPEGTFLNGQPVTEPTPLCSGDAIRVGQSLLRFGERPKRPISP